MGVCEALGGFQWTVQRGACRSFEHREAAGTERVEDEQDEEEEEEANNDNATSLKPLFNSPEKHTDTPTHPPRYID